MPGKHWDINNQLSIYRILTLLSHFGNRTFFFLLGRL
jgi:hypothetical protein